MVDDQFRFAHKVEVGSKVDYFNQKVEVVGISTVISKGKYSPLTESGTLRVNGVLVSCYAYLENQDWTHWWFNLYQKYWIGSLDTFITFSQFMRRVIIEYTHRY